MSNIAIRVENISKQYRLGEVGTGTLSHDLNRWWAKMRGKEDPFAKIGSVNNRTIKDDSEYVWALKDINFDVTKGEVLGIIGKNGAGKSTLLKILSRTTLPTTGSIKVHGRIASLLEVGTGFHPEMTGRENIYQNGAILGMTRHEITRKFDEIVDFAGVAKYIETPVKRYSSGMYVRLAFAVAAHLEPEILIVDEVLAVGDAEFQKKCLGKMKDVSNNEGRTVLFVSHDLGAVNNLCTNSILLTNGTIAKAGPTQEITSFYLKNSNESSSYTNMDIDLTKDALYSRIYLTKLNGSEESKFFHDEDFYINFELKINNDSIKYNLFVTIIDHLNRRICSAESDGISPKMSLRVDSNFLVRGHYSLHTRIHVPRVQMVDSLSDICNFSVIDNGSKLGIHGDYDYGSVFLKNNWEYQ